MAALERLQRLQNADSSERLTIAVQEKGAFGAEEPYLKHKMAMKPEDLRKISSDRVVRLKDNPLLLIAPEIEQTVRGEMKKIVGDFHAKNPLLPGIPKEELRTRFFYHMPVEVFGALLDHALESKTLQSQKDTVSLYGRKLALSAEEENLLSTVENVLMQSGVECTLESIVDGSRSTAEDSKKMLYLLVREGRAVKLADDYFIHRKVWEDLKNRIRSLKPRQGKLSVADFKALYGLSRKYAIPLLEQLDREGITRRSGNERIII